MSESLEQFFDHLSSSGLMTADEIAALRDSASFGGSPADTASVAQQLVEGGKLTNYQAERLQVGKVKGLVLNDYLVLDLLGRGGMGEVYRARHCRLDRLVAIKMLSTEALDSADSVERFHREVKAAAKLTHPNVVITYDAGEFDGIHYLVMEYVEGQDLASLVQQDQRLPVDVAVDYVLQAAAGLQYAHRQGVIHRDIKPSNLLVNREGVVKVLDMGLARIVKDVDTLDQLTRPLTKSGQMMGTFDYMAPEQAEDTHSADHRADIYALGCTLYRLLTGVAPYNADSMIKIVLAHREAHIPSIRASRQDVPESLDAAFRKMLEKSPQDRYQSMSDVIDALTACRIEILTAAGKQIPAELTNSELTRSVARTAIVVEPQAADYVEAAVVAESPELPSRPHASTPIAPDPLTADLQPEPAPLPVSASSRETVADRPSTTQVVLPPARSGPTFWTGLLLGVLVMIVATPLLCCGGCALMMRGCVVGEPTDDGREVAVIRSEMNELARALEEYKQKNGEYPPSDPEKAIAHVRRVFPRSAEMPTEFDDQSKALVFWLSKTSQNPERPFSGETKVVYFKFDAKRIDEDSMTYRPPGDLKAPYAYKVNEDGSFELRSAGPDDRSGTEDDLVVRGKQ